MSSYNKEIINYENFLPLNFIIYFFNKPFKVAEIGEIKLISFLDVNLFG